MTGDALLAHPSVCLTKDAGVPYKRCLGGRVPGGTKKPKIYIVFAVGLATQLEYRGANTVVNEKAPEQDVLPTHDVLPATVAEHSQALRLVRRRTSNGD
eukprot:2402655-Pleurochrysis_carterae.AAC.3